jgi:uncharacterized phage infection (PIP) family protein YhgE
MAATLLLTPHPLALIVLQGGTVAGTSRIELDGREFIWLLPTLPMPPLSPSILFYSFVSVHST